MNMEDYEKKGKSAVENVFNSFGDFFEGLEEFGKGFVKATGKYIHEVNEIRKNSFSKKD